MLAEEIRFVRYEGSLRQSKDWVEWIANELPDIPVSFAYIYATTFPEFIIDAPDTTINVRVVLRCYNNNTESPNFWAV